MSARHMHFARLLFLLAVLLNGAFLFCIQDIQARWANVPPVPKQSSAPYAALGDKQFAYRSFGLMIQNLGDIGGRVTNLDEYDFTNLGAWFRFMNVLDPQSDYIPFLAAYYFGGADHKAEDMAPVTDYLADIGNTSDGEKWRWLAQAVFLARYKEKNLDKALQLSYKLADLYTPGDMPAWTKQMPAFVTMAMGDKKAAFGIMAGILAGDTSQMDPAEVNYTKAYICEQILDETQAKDYPLCNTDKD